MVGQSSGADPVGHQELRKTSAAAEAVQRVLRSPAQQRRAGLTIFCMQPDQCGIV